MSLYQVSAILDRRYNSRNKRFQYKVKWKGYPQEEATWQPQSNLTNVREMIDQFSETHANGKNNQTAIKGQQKSKQIRMAIAENQQNLSALSNQVRSKKEKINNMSSQLPKIKSKNKAIKKSKPTARRRINNRQKSQQIQEEQQQKMQQPIQKQNQEMPSQGQQEEVVPEQLNSNQNHSKIDNLALNEQPLQEVLDIEVQPQIQEDRNFIIKGICRRNEVLIYRVSDNGQERWASKNEIIRQHPLSLIQFYQSKIKYYPISKQQRVHPQSQLGSKNSSIQNILDRAGSPRS